jgi:membrane-associated protease RseP (regulator of RpoE activity)
LLIACALFLLTLFMCLAAGTQFAISFARNQEGSTEAFEQSLELLYKHPAALAAGLPFALTLLAVLLVHELGHFYACRHHHIRSSYPFFIPAPTLIGTLGAFILIRSPFRNNRELFDVGASGPLAGFVVAVPALLYGVVHAKIVPNLAESSGMIFGSPLLLKMMEHLFRPGVAANTLLLHPVGRAAWAGLLATSLNLLPAVQLDGGHILRSLSPRAHRWTSLLLPVALVLIGYFYGVIWFVWAGLIFVSRFFRTSEVWENSPLDAPRRWAAAAAAVVFLVSFMVSPIE